MTKITLDQAKKDVIVTAYKAGTRTIHQLANQCGVARSTIRRVLNEADIYTPEQTERSKSEAVMEMLRTYGMDIHDLHQMLVFHKQASRSVLIKACMDMEEGTWGAFLNDVVTARVAKAHNVHTSSAMLRVQEKVDKNARDSKG